MQPELFKTVTRDERQEESRIKWIKNKCRGTIVASTGFGKTRVALNCLQSILKKYNHFRFLVIVPTDNLKIQWTEQLDALGLGLNGSVEIVNTVIKNHYKTDILIIDEAHRVNSDTFRELFNTVDYKYILGLTATFERLDDKHKEVMEKYCPVIDKISLEEALFNNWISKYKEYQVIVSVDDIESYKRYNKEFVEHFEFFNYDFNLAMSMIGAKGFMNRAKYRDQLCAPGADEKTRKNVFKNITYHATAFMRSIQSRKKFINNHPKKLELARKIIAARPDAKIITFSNNIQMAESIGIGQVYTGRDSKKKARASMDEFNMASSGVLNSVAKLNEGADIRGLSVAIVLGLDSSEIKATQRRGRAIRFEPGKEAEIFNLVLDQTVELEWFKKSHQNASYIVIDEEGLDDVLAGRDPKPYVRPVQNFTFRF